MPSPNRSNRSTGISHRPDGRQPRSDRRRNDRRGGGSRREPSEYEDATIAIDRVTRVVKGGRRMRFRAVVVIGNKKGKVGLGTGKASEVQGAIQKANRAAKSNIMVVPMRSGTISHEVNVKHKAARLRLMPASAGTGIIAGGPLRVILELAGITDILAKRFGTSNKLVNAQASIKALKLLRPVRAKKGAEDNTMRGNLTSIATDSTDEEAAPLEPNLPIKEVKVKRKKLKEKDEESSPQ